MRLYAVSCNGCRKPFAREGHRVTTAQLANEVLALAKAAGWLHRKAVKPRGEPQEYQGSRDFCPDCIRARKNY